MATVLPTSPPSYNANNVEGTVKSLCTYNSTTHEYLNYLISQLKTSISELESRIAALEVD